MILTKKWELPFMQLKLFCITRSIQKIVCISRNLGRNLATMKGFTFMGEKRVQENCLTLFIWCKLELPGSNGRKLYNWGKNHPKCLCQLWIILTSRIFWSFMGAEQTTNSSIQPSTQRFSSLISTNKLGTGCQTYQFTGIQSLITVLSSTQTTFIYLAEWMNKDTLTWMSEFSH